MGTTHAFRRRRGGKEAQTCAGKSEGAAVFFRKKDTSQGPVYGRGNAVSQGGRSSFGPGKKGDAVLCPGKTCAAPYERDKVLTTLRGGEWLFAEQEEKRGRQEKTNCRKKGTRKPFIGGGGARHRDFRSDSWMLTKTTGKKQKREKGPSIQLRVGDR